MLYGHTLSVKSVVFSPLNDHTLASGSQDTTVRLWGTDGDELMMFQGHQGPVSAVAFSPDGRVLASADDQNTVILWNLDADDLMNRACGWVQNYLQTHPERANFSRGNRQVCQQYLSPSPP
jgi:WD40 repeat protein